MSYKNIKVDDLFIQKGNKILFKETDLVINYGTRYALLGKNGIGKSSLAEFIYTKSHPGISDYLDMLYIHQEVEPTDHTVLQEVLTCNTERETLLQAHAKLLDTLSNEEETVDMDIIEHVQETQEQLLRIDYQKDEPIVKKILKGLGFQDTEFDTPVRQFSGGWRMRISLAKALYLQPTLLILDEPTNHLDLEAVIWLTDYLRQWKKTLLLISHNIGFIQETCTQIIHCENVGLHYYKGDYEHFIKLYNQSCQHQQTSYKKYEKQLKLLKNGKKSTKKDIQAFIKKHKVERPSLKKQIPFGFSNTSLTGLHVVDIKEVSFSYSSDNILFKNLNMKIDSKDRIALVGRNGSGKSTLCKLICGKVNPLMGDVINLGNMDIGYFNQHYEDVLPMELNSISYLQSIDPNINDEMIRKYLGSFQLPSRSHLMEIAHLSGGQKARLLFIGLILQEPDILLLDEPTNHLDIETIEWLIESIQQFNGGVVVVSHDEHFITSIDANLYILSNQTIQRFYGEYEEYRTKVLTEE